MAVSNVTLPNGERVNISHEDDATELDVLNFAYSEYVTNTDPGSAFGRGIRDGVDLLQTSYGSTLEGIGSLLDMESLQQVGADVIAEQRGQMDAEAYRQQLYGDQDEGILDYALNLAGASTPQMGSTFAGAGAGAAIGAGFFGVGAVPGAIIGGFLANMPYFYGDNRERQKEAIERGFRTEIDEGAAALYAVPASVLDAAFSAIGAKFLSSGALKAGGGLLTRATRGAVEGAIIEAPTELGQQFLNRYQAGLPIDSDEAKLEYIEAAKGGALLGGLFSGGGRAVFGSKEGADAMPEPAEEETVQMPSVTTPEGQATSPEVGEILEGAQPLTDEDIQRAINTADTLEEQFPGQDRIEQEQMDQYRSDLENKKRVMKELDAAIEPDQQAFDESLASGPSPVDPVVKEDESNNPIIRFNRDGLPYRLKGTYIRFGELPEGPSEIANTGKQELGHSVYLAYFDPKTKKYILLDNPFERGIATQDSLISGSRKIYEVSGKRIGTGSDGESLLDVVTSKQLKEIKRSDIVLKDEPYQNIDLEPIDGEAGFDMGSATLELPEGFNLAKYTYKKAYYGDFEIFKDGKLVNDAERLLGRSKISSEAEAKMLIENLINEDLIDFRIAQSEPKAQAEEGLTAQDEAALEAEMQRELSGDIAPEGPVPVDPFVEEPEAQPESIVESAPVTAPAEEVAFKIETDMNPNYTKGGDQRRVMGYKVRARNGRNFYIEANYEAPAQFKFLVYTGSEGYPGGQEAFEAFPTKKDAVEYLRGLEPEAVAAPAQEAAPEPEGALTQEETDYILNQSIGEHGEVLDQEVDLDSGEDVVVGVSTPINNTIPNAPTISRDILRDFNAFVYFADRMAVGTYTGLDPNSNINISMQGGAGYPFIPKNQQANAGWAFTAEGIFTRFNKKVKSTDGVGLVALYKKENLRANETFLKAYIEEVKYAIKEKKISTGKFLEIANTARKQVVNLKTTSKSGKVTFAVKRNSPAFKLFNKNFKSVSDFNKAMKAGGFEVRGKMLGAKDATVGGQKVLRGERMGSAANVKAGMPDIVRMIDLFTEPSLRDLPRGQIVAAVEFDKGQTSSVKAQQIGADPHTAYPLVIKGRGLGVFQESFNVNDVLKSNKQVNQALRSAETSFPEAATLFEYKGTQTAINAVNALKNIISNNPNGFTVELDGQPASTGYVVAPDKSTEFSITPGSLTDETLITYLIRHSDKLEYEGAMIGGYFNPDKGVYQLDITFAIDKKQDAINIGIWGDQDSIYNLDKQTVIELRDGKGKQKLPKGDKRSIRDLLSKRPGQNPSAYASSRGRKQKRTGRQDTGDAGQPEVTAGTDTGPEIADIINEGKTFENAGQLDRFISKVFTPIARKLGVDIIPNYSIGRALQYNVTQGVIEYNPVGIINNTREYLTAGMREELIHAAMHKVLINQNKGKTKVAAWVDFMTKLGKDLTPEQREALAGVYRNLGDDMEFGAEYSRAVIQESLYGDITEVYAQGKSFEKIKKLFRSIQGFVARTFGSEVSNPEVAGVIRASADLLKAVDPSVRPSNQVVVGAAMNNSVDLNPNSEITSHDVVEAGKPPSKRKVDLNFADKYLFTVSSVLGKIHPRLKLLIRDYYGLIQSKVLSYQTAMAPFFKKMRAIKNKTDRRRLKQLLMYSPMVADAGTAEQEALLAKYGMLEDYNNLVRPALRKLRADLEARGVLIGDLFDYFPRRIKNFKALQAVKAYWGKTVGASFKSFIDTRNEDIMEVRRKMLNKNAELVTASNDNDQAAVQKISAELKALSAEDDVIITIGSEETALQEAQEWDKFITKFSESNPDMLPGNARERAMKGQIPDELLQYYEDPAPAMESYIFNMVSATETVKLIGNRFVTNQQGTELGQASKLGILVQELRASGAIINQQADHTIPEIMKLILSPKKGESRLLQLARSFGYGTLLIEFTSTLSQLYDLPFIMLDNGFFPTLNAMFGSRLKGSAFGIDTEKISQEFEGDDKFLEKAVRLGLRSTGFTKLDQIMKETNLTANYRRFRKLANLYYKDRNNSRIKTFTAELTALGYSPEEQNQLIADLKKGDQDSALVRSLLFNKLAETQPLTSAEMAMGIVGNPNLRIAVAMKSFMVKQMVFTKDRMLDDMFGRGKTNAQRLKASKDLTKLLAFMLLIGVPADALKDFLAGRVGYLDDYLFDGVFRVAGVSRYTGYKIRSEGIGRAAFDYATPVAFQQAMDASGELQRVLSGERALSQSKFVAYAPYSDVINRMFGFQKVKERKTLKRKASQGESPLFIPPGAL